MSPPGTGWLTLHSQVPSGSPSPAQRLVLVEGSDRLMGDRGRVNLGLVVIVADGNRSWCYRHPGAHRWGVLVARGESGEPQRREPDRLGWEPSQQHEVRIGGLVPGQAGCAEPHKPVDLG